MRPGWPFLPTGARILYVQEDQLNSDLVLVENFPFSVTAQCPLTSPQLNWARFEGGKLFGRVPDT